MRLATITNWAYGATVLLTAISGGTMLLASAAQENERVAVAQRYQLDHLTSQLGNELYALTSYARQYAITGDPVHLLVYAREAEALKAVEDRIRHVEDVGATASELAALKEALRWADALHDEQLAALEAQKQGQTDKARSILFGAEYERELSRAENLLERFQYELDSRTDATVNAATDVAKMWRIVSEVMLCVTGLLFLCVLYFLFKKRVLRPVVRLSDVVGRLAAQDFAVEMPVYDQIDEIGDMTQAIRVFRENGLYRQRLEQEREADHAVRDLMARMTQRMQGCDTIGDLKDVVQRFVPEIAPALAGRLYLLDESRNAMVETCSWLSPLHSRPEFAPIGCWALRRGVLHRPAGTHIDVPCEHMDVTRDAPVDSICLPLTAQRETLGLLYFEPRGDEPSAFGETPENYFDMLAENIGLALANLRLREKLRGLAMADPLTGLPNRRSLDELLSQEVSEAARLGSPLSCLMLDVDHFKRFNDEFGHDGGDAVLRSVGETLANATRENGMAFRYGGEEFVLLMPGLTGGQARERAEAVREAIASLSIEYDGKVLGKVTASLGIASFPEDCAGTLLVQTADAALLQAKASGRNRAVSAGGQGDRRAVA